MQVLNDFSQYTPIIATVGVIAVILGFFLKGEAKKNTGSAVFSMILLAIGAACLIYALSQWLPSLFKGWDDYGQKYL